jgi:hypothetical protein
MNQPSIFAILDGEYVGCKIYPHIRKYPDLEYWKTATCSDSDRYFSITEKQFSDEEIATIKNLQKAIDSLSDLIPQQPNLPLIPINFKIKRGKVYEDYKEKRAAQSLAVSNYFSAIEIFDKAKNKAAYDLRLILNKN